MDQFTCDFPMSTTSILSTLTNCSTMPSISPPISSSPETNHNQVQFLLDLLAAFQAIGPHYCKTTARLSLALDLKEQCIPVIITNENAIKKHKQTIQIGNGLVFTSFGRRPNHCAKCIGSQLFWFFEGLQLFIQNAQTVLSNQAFDSCPIAQLEFLQKSFQPTDKIQIKQNSQSVAIKIAENTVLYAEGALQREAARDMVSMLARLIQAHASVSLNGGNCQQQTPISTFTVTPTLAKATVNIDKHIIPKCATLSTSSASNIAANSLSLAMSGQTNECQPVAERTSTGKRQRKNVFSRLFTRVRKLMGLSLKKTNLPPSTAPSPKVELLPPLPTGSNFAQMPPLDLSKCELIPSPPASLEELKPIATLATAGAPSASRKSSTSDNFVISQDKLAKRWQLLLDYTQFATEDRTDLEILKHLMENDGTQFIVTAVPAAKGRTRVVVTISEIHTLEAIASSEEEARGQALQKMANYLASIAQLVKRFKSLYLLEKTTLNAEDLIATLVQEFPNLIRITRKSPSLNQYSTTVALVGLTVIPSPLMDNKVASEVTAFIRTIEYLEKLAQFDSAVFSEPVYPSNNKPALPLKIKTELLPLVSLSPEEITRKKAALLRLLHRLVSLPLNLRVNVHHVVEHLNAGSNQSVPLLLISESSEIVFEHNSEKNISIYKIKLELPECLGIFIGTSMKMRESRAIASLKVLAFANEWLKLLKYFSFVNTKQDTALQILERLKCKFKCRMIRIHGNRIDLIPVVFYEESSVELSAIKVVAYLETLTREMAPFLQEEEKLADKKIEQLTSFLSVYESIISDASKTILKQSGEQWKILELMKEKGEPIDLFCQSFDERWRCDRNDHRVFGAFPERCLRKTPIFSCYSPRGEIPPTTLMTPRLIYDREILLSLRETAAMPPKAPLRLLKDLMNYSSSNTDVVYGNTSTCRVVVIFGDLAAFTAIRDDPLEAQEAAANEAIDFLKNILNWMHLNAESSTRVTLTRLTTEYPTQLKVFTPSDSTGAFRTSVDVLNSTFVFQGQSQTSPDEATQFAGEQLLSFLEKLTTEMKKRKEQASEAGLQKQAWAVLTDRFNSVYSSGEAPLQILEKLRLKGVHIQCATYQDADGQFSCVLTIVRPRQLKITGKSSQKREAKREAAKNLFAFLRENPEYDAIKVNLGNSSKTVPDGKVTGKPNVEQQMEKPKNPSLPEISVKIQPQTAVKPSSILPASSELNQSLPEKLQIGIQLLADYRLFALPGATNSVILQQIMNTGKTAFKRSTEANGEKYRTTLHMVGIHQVVAVAASKKNSKKEAHQVMARFTRDIVALVDDFTVAVQSGKQSSGKLLNSLASKHASVFTMVQSQTKEGQYRTAVNILGMVSFDAQKDTKEKAEAQVYSQTVQYLKYLSGLIVSKKTAVQTVALEANATALESSIVDSKNTSPTEATVVQPSPFSSPFIISEEKLTKRRQLLAEYAQIKLVSSGSEAQILSQLMALKGGTKFSCTVKRHSNHKLFRGTIKIGDIHLLEACASSEAQARAEVLQKTAVYASSIARLIDRFKVLRLNAGGAKSDAALVAVLANEYPKLVRIFRKTHKPNLYSTTVDLSGLDGFVGKPMASKATSEGTTFRGAVEYLEMLSKFELKSPNLKQPLSVTSAASSVQAKPTAQYRLPQEASKRIYDAIANRWKSLPMENRRCKVLAAFVLTSDRDQDDIRVLSIGTGSKIISSDALQAETGTVVHDSHAEVIARRALICLFYEHLMALLDNGLAEKPQLILEQVPENSSNSCFRLKAHLKLHLYVTVPPCGASFQGPDDKLRFKKEAISGYFEADETFISNLCNIQAGKNGSTFMACSDKITMWNVAGVQGALLSQFLEPIYLTSLLVSENFKYDTFTRAFYGRVNSNKLGTYLGEKSAGFRLNEHLVGVYRPKDHEKCLDLNLSKKASKCSFQSHNWYHPLGSAKITSVEVINSRKGTLFHSEGKPSRLAKCRLVERYQRLIAHKHFVVLSTSLTSNSDALTIARHGKNRGTYANLKEQSVAYQAAKIALVRTLEESGLGSWIHAYGGVQDMFPVK